MAPCYVDQHDKRTSFDAFQGFLFRRWFEAVEREGCFRYNFARIALREWIMNAHGNFIVLCINVNARQAAPLVVVDQGCGTDIFNTIGALKPEIAAVKYAQFIACRNLPGGGVYDRVGGMI